MNIRLGLCPTLQKMPNFLLYLRKVKMISFLSRGISLCLVLSLNSSVLRFPRASSYRIWFALSN